MWWAKLGLALMALGMMSTVPVRAADEIGETARLITWCSQPDGTQGRGFCLAYIHAIAQRVEDQDRISVLMFLLFTDRHPELLHKHPSVLISQAIAEAFPCRS